MGRGWVRRTGRGRNQSPGTNGLRAVAVAVVRAGLLSCLLEARLEQQERLLFGDELLALLADLALTLELDLAELLLWEPEKKQKKKVRNWRCARRRTLRDVPSRRSCSSLSRTLCVARSSGRTENRIVSDRLERRRTSRDALLVSAW